MCDSTERTRGLHAVVTLGNDASFRCVRSQNFRGIISQKLQISF